MKAKLITVLEKTLVLALLASFLLPLALAAWLRLSHNTSSATNWLRNATLRGVGYTPQDATPSLPAVLSAKYQTAVGGNYDHNFPARELLIRFANEIYVGVFKVSNNVIIGRHDTLYDERYLREYSLYRIPKKVYIKHVSYLRRMQDFCEARGIAFAVLVTPNKSSIYPEDMPEHWLRWYNPKPRNYENFVSLLQERGVRYVDGPRIVADLKKSIHVPLFPRGGLHWTDPAALATGNALVELLAKQGLPVETIKKYETRVTEFPKDDWDRDLAELVNRVSRFSYPVPEITAQPVNAPGRYHPNIVFVGGSFEWKILRLLDESAQFSEISLFDYYKHSKCCQVDGVLRMLAAPTPPVDFNTEVFAADALVLEVNQEALYSPNHVTRFLSDALAVLPDPRAPKADFHHVAQEFYRWGDTVSLMAGKNPAKIIAGFTNTSDQGTFTDGPLASVRLGASPPKQDMRMEVTASGFVIGTRLPEQEVNVSINDFPVGQMVWKTTTPTTQALLVPKELLSEGLLRLQFRLPHATSPADLGLSDDRRKLGICVSGIRFTPVDEARTGGGGLIYHWGETLSFVKDTAVIAPEQLGNFTPPSEQGSYTVGPVASVQFTAPPAPADMVLSVDAGAFLVDTRLAEQHVDVFVNGHAIGQWTWNDAAPSMHTLPVPKEFLSGGSTRLEFRVARPTSPAELGLGADARKFGIFILKARLHEAGK